MKVSDENNALLMDRRVDVALAVCVVLLGIFVLVSAQGIRNASVPDPIGSRGAPDFVGVVLILGGFVLILRRLLSWRSESTYVLAEGVQDDPGVSPGSSSRPLLIWGSAMVYLLVMPTIGYLIATPLFLGAVLWLFQIRRSWLLIAVPMLATLGIASVFVLFLHVRLPTGLLDSLLRQIGFV